MLDVSDGDEGFDVIEVDRIIIKLYFVYFRLDNVPSILPTSRMADLSAYFVLHTIYSVEKVLLLQIPELNEFLSAIAYSIRFLLFGKLILLLTIFNYYFITGGIRLAISAPWEE